MSIHRTAMEHLDKAKRLLAAGDIDSLRYAALEMRYCIEHLFYRIIPQYKEELPENVLSDTWKPGDIVAMIAAIDPGVSNDRRLRMGLQSEPGVPSTKMWDMGSQTGLRKDLARRMWNGLGFYLHARIDQRPHDPAKLRARLEKILPRLEQFRADRIIVSGLHAITTFACEDCGRALAKRMAGVKADPLATCPSGSCGAIYKITDLGGDNAEWRQVQENLKCDSCGADNWLGVHKWRKGAASRSTVTCRGCGLVYRLSEYVMVTPYKDRSEPTPTG